MNAEMCIGVEIVVFRCHINPFLPGKCIGGRGWKVFAVHDDMHGGILLHRSISSSIHSLSLSWPGPGFTAIQGDPNTTSALDESKEKPRERKKCAATSTDPQEGRSQSLLKQGPPHKHRSLKCALFGPRNMPGNSIFDRLHGNERRSRGLNRNCGERRIRD